MRVPSMLQPGALGSATPHICAKVYGKRADEQRTVVERQSRVLLLSCNPAQLDMISRQAPADRFECVPVSDIQEGLALLRDEAFDVFVVDEDLEGVSGVDVLIQARELEPYTTFILVVDEDLAVEVAADALNQADVTRILLAPYSLEEWVECCEDARERYEQNVRTRRNLNLSRAKVRRLHKSVEQSKRDLIRKSRQIEQMRKAPVAPAPMAVAQKNSGESEKKLHAKISNLLTRVILAGAGGPAVKRLRDLVEYCARKLKWPASEIRLLSEASVLHHALLGEFPGETRNELRAAKTKHADVMDELLSGLPGFADVAQIVGEHHGRRAMFDTPDQEQEISRSARLLQILSLFDEILHDPRLLASEQCKIDPDLPINRASESVLRLANEGKLDPELSEVCIKHLIPKSLDREETCLHSSDLEAGMQLSRSIYADNLMLLKAMETLNETTLEQIRYADETQKFAGIWVVGRIQPTKEKAS